VAADRLRFAAISGTSAGAFNAAPTVSGLVLFRDDKFVEYLGFVSKNSTSWGFLTEFRDVGYQTEEMWVTRHWTRLARGRERRENR
jgi:predicted acylesterase/phospholipase RssA